MHKIGALALVSSVLLIVGYGLYQIILVPLLKGLGWHCLQYVQLLKLISFFYKWPWNLKCVAIFCSILICDKFLIPRISHLSFSVNTRCRILHGPNHGMVAKEYQKIPAIYQQTIVIYLIIFISVCIMKCYLILLIFTVTGATCLSRWPGCLGWRSRGRSCAKPGLQLPLRALRPWQFLGFHSTITHTARVGSWGLITYWHVSD